MSSRRETRSLVRCTLCNGQKKLWLGGKDYVECPAECDERGMVPVVKAMITPSVVFAVTAPQPPR